jgi:uncharacterized delta-60 repeat protein
MGQLLRIQPDGKLLMAGTCTRASNEVYYPSFCATRLRADGHYDTTFGLGGVGYVSFNLLDASFPSNAILRDMVRLADGRLLFLGSEGLNVMILAVLAANGNALEWWMDFQFENKPSAPSAMTLQTDGKVLVAGSTIGPNGNRDMAVRRFMPDFAPDLTFGNPGNYGNQIVAFDLGGPSGDDSDIVSGIALQTDGRILLVGTAAASTGVAIALARLLPSGQLDSDFGPDHDGRAHFLLDGYPYSIAKAVRVDSSGRIVFAGQAAAPPSAPACLINRLLADGSQDPDFSVSSGAGHPAIFYIPVGGVDHPCRLNDLAGQDAEGTTLAVGTVQNGTGGEYFGAVRLEPNGQLDNSFGFAGRSYGTFASSNDVFDEAGSVAIGSGGLMIAGSSQDRDTSEVKFGIAKLILDKIFASKFDN